MKLNPEIKRHIDNLIKRKLSELSPGYRSEIQRIRNHPTMPKIDRTRELLNIHTKHIREISDFTVHAYLSEYQAERQMPDDNELVEIGGKLGLTLNKEISDSVLHLPLDLTLSSESEKLIRDAQTNADTDLRNARTEAELEAKRTQHQQKRNRVLRRIYDESGPNPMKGVRYDAIQEKERMPIDEIQGIVTYLSQDGLLGSVTPHKCFISSEGINKVETELLPQRKPNIPALPEESIDFSFIADHRIRMIIERDYDELESLEPENETKSVLVLCGSIIEGMLLDAIVTSGYWTYAEASERFLKDMIHPAKAKGIIQHDNLSEVLRIFRNLIHPAREIRDNLVFDTSHANHARAAVDVIISEVRKWYASRKT